MSDDEDFFQEAFDDSDDSDADANFDADSDDDRDRDLGEKFERDDPDDVFVGSYADKERTGVGGFANSSKYGVYSTREEIFVGKFSTAYYHISGNKGVDHWVQQFAKTPTMYYLNPEILAAVLYAKDVEDDQEFMEGAPSKSGIQRTKFVVNKIANLARDKINGTIKTADVYRYYVT